MKSERIKPYSSNRPQSYKLQVANRLVLGVVIMLTLWSLGLGPGTSGTAYAADGDLDPTFDGDGKVTTDFGSGIDRATGMAIQPDGKIVAAGIVPGDASIDFGLARYNTDGSLDITFGGDGTVTTDFGTNAAERALEMALQADGKIVVAGSTIIGSNSDFALARYNADGSLDTTFSGDGRATLDFAGGLDEARAVAIQPDGKIVAAGVAHDASQIRLDFALARYNPDGSLDTSFDGDGKVTIAFGANNITSADAVAIQPDGKIVAAGQAQVPPTGADFALARFNADGSLDTSFDGDGKVLTDFAGQPDIVRGMVLQTDGKIVVAGYADTSGGDRDFGLARYNPDGSLDTSFDGDGKVTTSFGGAGYEAADAVAIQVNGKIVAAGDVAVTQNNRDHALARYNADGSLDTSFGGDGRVTADFFADDFAFAVAIQADGKIVSAGYAGPTNIRDFALARLTSLGPTPTPGPSLTPSATSIPIPSPTPGACGVQFPDVPPGSTFYPYVHCLQCRGIVSGFHDGLFRTHFNVTRGQISKMVSGSAGFNEAPGPQIYDDVPPSHTYYPWINRLTRRGIMAGYPCPDPGEPCVPHNALYFQPNLDATRGQLAKIVSNAAGYQEPPSTQTFEDVPPSNPFYVYVERLALRDVMHGYACGGVGEPCGTGNRPYFRPFVNISRGQASKIVANTFFPNCQTP